jgi:serine/threonine protein kinase
VRILDGGLCEKSGFYFVVMEFIGAPNLATVISDVPRDRIWPIISQVARAARFLEGLGLAHRDIKPDNIAVTRDFQTAILLDLGVIRPFNVASVTDGQQRTFVGTLQYSSPEFLFRTEEDNPDGWRAVTFYQLGAVLHDMIMQKRLFSEFADPFARLVEAVKHEIPGIEAPDVPPDLVLLAKNCLTKDPALRLRFVRWEDFEPKETRSVCASDAKERIRKRRAVAQQIRPPETDLEGERKVRELRRKVEEIRAKLQEIIRCECIGSDLFPPMEVHDSQDEQAERTHFVVFFSASPDHALWVPLSIWFSVTLLDEKSLATKLECVAALWPNRLRREDIAGRTARLIFEGVLEELAVKQRLQELLYPLLDEAQQAVSGGNTSSADRKLVWLELRNGAHPKAADE